MTKFVTLAQKKDADSFAEAFNEAVANKVVDALNSKKQEIAEGIFGVSGEVSEETVVSEEYHKLSDDAKELVLHADNDSHLHHSSHEPIMNNLAKKHAKGVYDSEKAKKLWGYHADRAAQSYHKEHGGGHGKWHEMFPTHVRKEAAAHWEEHHREDLHEDVLKESKPSKFDNPTSVYKPSAGPFRRNEEVEQIEEVAAPGQEDFIKDAKPDFKKRYGARWKEVLYAKAWKNAKNK